ncbi:MAG: OPT/YSL family transporter [Verrucomicrobiales bacterium]|nr:OPT/YSL family transporter [Verrucomicrobiales bacterium]
MSHSSQIGKDPASEPGIPELPDDATPEEKDLHWFRHVYQGDNQPQLTVRAVLTGGLLGMFMAASHIYTSLKIGWGFGVAITACVLSYVLWNGFGRIFGGKQLSILENNCMQSTASAAGYSTGSLVVAAFGALLLMEGEHRPWFVVAPVILLTAALGVFLAIPMKRQMINHEQLPFPSGIAAAATLKSLYSAGREAVAKAWALVWGLIAGAVIGVLRNYVGMVDALEEVGRAPRWMLWLREHKWFVPDTLPLPGNPTRANIYGYAFEPSFLLIAAGMIVGLRVSLSMLAGAAGLYFIAAPMLEASLMDFDAAHQSVQGFKPYIASTPAGSLFKITQWSLWGGTAVMVFSSLTSVALQWKTISRAFRRDKSGAGTGTEQDALARIEVPGKWLWMGLIPVGIGLVWVQYWAFQISIPLGIIAVLLSFVLALVACRATGETDTTPLGAMGKVTQLLYAVLPGAKGVGSINLMSAGVTASAAGSAADLLTDLKSGYLLGANPRKQFLAQFYGIFFGTLAVVPAWFLMVPDKAALEKFPAIPAVMWKAVADLLTQGIHMLPASAAWAIVIGAIVGVALPVGEALFPKARKYFPSAMGLGLAWVVPFQNALAFAIGAVIAWLWSAANKKQANDYTVPSASGLIAGESLIAALIAIACTIVGLALKS